MLCMPCHAVHAAPCCAGNVETLRAAGIHVASLANNHTLDWCEKGLLESLDTLNRAGGAACSVCLHDMCVYGLGKGGAVVGWSRGASWSLWTRCTGQVGVAQYGGGWVAWGWGWVAPHYGGEEEGGGCWSL